jgi:lipid A 3-O-deacylase
MRSLIVFFVIFLFQSTFAFADCVADNQINFKNYNFRIENDYFNHQDSNYTSGVVLSGVTQDFKGDVNNECLPTITRLHGKLLSFIDSNILKKEEGVSKNIYFNASQRMYTPGNDKVSTLIRDDRPYAGIIALGVGVNERHRNHSSDTQVLDTKELTLGVIGPASFARQTQNIVHDTFNVYRAAGWNNQLSTEPAVMYMFERKIKTDLQQNSYTPGYSKDLIKFYGLRVGNIETSVNAGIEGRYGLNIPNDFGSAADNPGCDNTAPSPGSIPPGKSELCTDKGDLILPIPLGAHLFALAELTGVAYDFSLDGNMFGDNHHVHRNPAVGKVSFGISSLIPLQNEKNLKLVAMQVIQSKEFEEQKKIHKYVSLTVGLDF